MSIYHQNTPEVSHPQHYLNSDKDSDSKEPIPEQEEEKVLGKILGIDFGSSKVGLALADSETKIAFAHKTIKNDKNFLPNLMEIIAKENVEKAVIGIPTHNMSDKTAKEAQLFAEELKGKLDISVEFQDEMFTTKMAGENLKEAGAKNIQASDDAEAARIILQSWLDKETVI